MNIGDVELANPSQTSLQERVLPDGSGSASEGSSALCLSRKEFTEKALDILNELRKQGQLCDAVIKVGDEALMVHRNILSASSAYFKALFTTKGFQPTTKQQMQEVELSGVSPDTMQCLIDYAYSRQILITEANVEQIMQAADRFLMPKLSKACCEFLKRQLCAQNCLGIARFARAYCRTGLEKTALTYACSNFNEVVASSPEFLEADPDFLYELLSSDNLNVRNEAFVFEAICKWIQHAPETRKAEMARMLRTVRLGFLSTQFLVERMKPHPYIRESEAAKALVIEAIKYLCKLELTDTQEVSVPMAKPRVPHEILFVIGGWSGGSPTSMVETYDTRADRWLVCEERDTGARAYHGCVALGQMIYVVGGFDGIEYFNSCRKFNTTKKQWYPAPPMNSKRCYISAVAHSGMIYVMGGFDGHVRLNSAERFDPARNQWSFILPMIHQRSDAKAAVLDDRIYICGGFNGQECLNSAEYYDPSTNQWTLIAPMRNRRSGVGVIAYHGQIYALGGFNGITRMNTGERYCPKTRTWTTIPEMYSPRSNFAVGVIDDLLFTIGGFNGVTTISQVECFDSDVEEWFDAAPLSLYRSALCACVVKDMPNVHEFVHHPSTRGQNAQARNTTTTTTATTTATTTTTTAVAPAAGASTSPPAVAAAGANNAAANSNSGSNSVDANANPAVGNANAAAAGNQQQVDNHLLNQLS